MKKRLILIAGLILAMAVSLTACQTTEEQEHSYLLHKAVEATCETDGNQAYYTCSHCNKLFDLDKNEIQSIPVVLTKGHDFELVAGTPSTCATSGTIDHYKCNGCEKLFDLTYEEISSIDGQLDYLNHEGDVIIEIVTAPTKLTYFVGEQFDMAGMAIIEKCSLCDGSTIDNQYLTIEYQTEGGSAFSLGDTKVTIKYGELSLEIEGITVSVPEIVLTGVEDSYQTTCKSAPTLNVATSVVGVDVSVEYKNADGEIVSVSDLAVGEYSMRIFVESTDDYIGTEVVRTLTVAHGNQRFESDEEVSVKCACGEKVFAIKNGYVHYVDSVDMSNDFGALVEGEVDFEIVSIKQIQLLNDNAKVDIVGTNESNVYTYSVDLYEKTSFYDPPEGERIYYTPYELVLEITYAVNGEEYVVSYISKYVEKVIRTKEDLVSVVHTTEGKFIDGHYVLANDIDATGLTLPSSLLCFNQNDGFRGVFEGNGYTISNLTLPSWGYGLFGAIGYNGRIQNVTFTNLTVGEDGKGLAFAVRSAHFKNVRIEFSEDSSSMSLAYYMNDTTFENVVIKGSVEAAPYEVTAEGSDDVPSGVSFEYLPYCTVIFDTAGGSQMEDVCVSLGKVIPVPTNPERESTLEYVYEFLGWYNGDVLFDFDTVVDQEELTLVAKWNQIEVKSAEEVVAMIADLPVTINLPSEVYKVVDILNAKADYNRLSDSAKDSVTNYEKLATLIEKISGYETLYIPNSTGIKAIPAALHNNNGGVQVSGALSNDSTYGTTFVATAETNGKAAIQFVNFPSVAGYDKIYFFVKASAGAYLYMADDHNNDGWGTNWTNNSGTITSYPITANEWSLVCLEVSTGIITDDWVISVWNAVISNATLEIGAIFGCNSSLIVEATEVEVSLNIGQRTDTGTSNEHGKIFNVIQEQWFIDNPDGRTFCSFGKGALQGALPSGFDHFEFWLYNPTDTTYSFHLAGDVNGEWTDSASAQISLPGKTWTKVTISNADILNNANGQWYMYIMGGNNDGAQQSGWQISPIYAVKA